MAKVMEDTNWRKIVDSVAEFIANNRHLEKELAHNLGSHVSRDYDVRCRNIYNILLQI